MKFEFYDPKLQALFTITEFLQRDEAGLCRENNLIKIIWNRSDQTAFLEVDGIGLSLAAGQITTTTHFHCVHYPHADQALTAILFNREFYCLADHDSEIGCNGILFFGTQDLPIITIPDDQKRKFELLWEVMLEEFRTRDNVQGEMLQMLLKRFIIICTRLAREQLHMRSINDHQIDAIRQFNYFVDMHFKTKRRVKDYADMLNKSPKTLSNLFALYNQKSPQQVIQERVVLEAKRLLRFTDKQSQEIAYQLGFEDPAHFSRYFKKVAHISPTEYKEKHTLHS